MLHDRELRDVLARMGWTIAHLTENALRDRERAYDVTRVSAQRLALRATIVVARDCAEGSFVDRFAVAAPSPTVAVRRAGDAKVVVEVCDFERARSEARLLLAHLSGDFRRRCIDDLAERGWRVIDETGEATFGWDGSWQLRAERPGEAMLVGIVQSAAGDAECEESIVARGTATATVGGLSLFVTVTSATASNELADALIPASS